LSDSVTELGGLNVGAEDFLAAVLQAAAQPIWVVDAGGLIRFANPAAIATLGYDAPDELLGRHSHETIHYKRPDGSHYPAAECPMLLPRTTGETVSSELDWFFRRDGTMFPVSYVSVPLDLSEGRGAVVAFTDIEARLRAEQMLREREAILAEEQASLRRVAALVAGGAAPTEVFATVAKEVAQVLGVPLVELSRFDGDGAMTVIGAWADRPHPFQPGTHWPLDGPTLSARISGSGRPARIDDFGDVEGTIAAAVRAAGIRSGAGAPILVDGEIWGMMAAASVDDERLPEGIEHRLADFTALIATAITIVVIVIYILVCLGTVVFYLRDARSEFNPLLHLVFPVLGAVAFAFPLYYTYKDRSDYPVGYANWIAIGWMVLGLAVTVWMSLRRRQALDNAERIFVDDEAAPAAAPAAR